MLTILVLALAAQSVVAATGRELLQSGTSCPTKIPGCRPRRCTTRILGSVETYVCLRCQNGMVPALGSDGRSVIQCSECSLMNATFICYIRLLTR